MTPPCAHTVIKEGDGCKRRQKESLVALGSWVRSRTRADINKRRSEHRTPDPFRPSDGWRYDLRTSKFPADPTLPNSLDTCRASPSGNCQ